MMQEIEHGPGKRNITNPTPSKEKRPKDQEMDNRTVVESVIDDHGVNILDDFEMELEADRGQDRQTYAEVAAIGTNDWRDYPYLIMLYGWSDSLPCDLPETIFNDWMDKLNDIINNHVDSGLPPKLDCEGRSFSEGKAMFFPNDVETMNWLDAKISTLEKDGITPRIVKPNEWK